MRTAVKLLTVIFLGTVFESAQAKTITVHSLVDDGPGSLRQAIATASDGDKINIVVNGPITLTSGELLLDKSVTIKGPGPFGFISGNNTSRVFHIAPGANVTLDSLTITNGATSRNLNDFPNSVGAGIYADHAKLTVSNCAISNNSAAAGGAIFSNAEGNANGSLDIRNTLITGNSASFGAGVYNDAEGGEINATFSAVTFKSNSADFGGGLFNDGELNGKAVVTLDNCDFVKNVAVNHGGAIENNGEGGQARLAMKNCRIRANSAATGSGVTVFFYGGAGIFNDGYAGNAAMLLEDTSVTDNQAGFFDASPGIVNHGFQGNAACTLKNCRLSDNRGPLAAAVVRNYGPGGRAILEITNCAISENSGTGIRNFGFDDRVLDVATGTAYVTIANSTVTRNTGQVGGGILNDTGGFLDARNTMITDNHAFAAAGMFNIDADATLTNCTVDSNSATSNTGAILNLSVSSAATLTINRCRISKNTARTFCGGIGNGSSDDPDILPGAATLTINNTTISGNEAAGEFHSGGGIHNAAGKAAAKIAMNNCTVTRNAAPYGGGISNGSAEGSGALATVTLTNTTLSENTGTTLGGAIWEEGFGSDPVVVLNNCTLSGNTAPSGGGVAVEGNPTDGFHAHPVVLVVNTIVNRGTTGENLLAINTGGVISHGYNFSSDAAGGDSTTGPGGLLNAVGDIRNRNPLLGPLQNNGGLTLTHALLPNSPAINTGDPNFNPYSFNPPELYDQRGPGFPRIVNGRVDIGAFEVQP